MTDQKTAEVVKGSCHNIVNWNESGATVGKSSKNGLSWEIQFSTKLAPFDSFKKIDRCVYFMWKFEWDETELKKQGYDGYEGEVVAEYKDQNDQTVRLPYNVELIHSGQWIQKRIGTEEETRFSEPGRGYARFFKMDFSLKKFSFETKPVASNFNDAVLVVEGRKIDVNMKYLSMHSEYFNKLFSSEFKEKAIPEIAVDDVKYADFSQLLETIHPTRPDFPTDENIENLLELADRFMLPVVVERVINHLRYSSNLSFEDFLKLTDKKRWTPCNMDKLWELNLKSINTVQRMQQLMKKIEYGELSETAKDKLFGHLHKLIKS